MLRIAVLARGPLRARERRRLRDRYASSRRVLFVCLGNICRSPFAAEYARGVGFDGREIASSGVHPRAGRSAPDTGIAAAAAFGVDLAPHRSRVLDEAQIGASDLVLVFDEQNWQTLHERFPHARGKIHRLGAAIGGAIEIADPYGRTRADFDRAYRRIAEAVDVLRGWSER